METDIELEKKVEEQVSALIDAKVKSFDLLNNKEDKCILQTNPLLKKNAPFVKLSKEVSDWVEGFRTFAKSKCTVISKGLSENSDVDGGFLVPEELKAEILSYAIEESIIRPRATVINMTRDKVAWPVLDQSSSNLAGVSISWGDESTAFSSTSPTFKKIQLNANKMLGYSLVPNEILDDSVVNLANFLVGWFGKAMAYEEDYRFLRGTGAGQPLGIITDPNVPTVDRTTASYIKGTDIDAMWEKLPAWAEQNAAWITTKEGMKHLMRIRSGVYNATTTSIDETKGDLLFLRSYVEGVPSTMLGRPVLITDKLPAVGTQGDLILADLSQYYIGDRQGFAVDVSPHVRFNYDELAFRFKKRVDGQVAIQNAFVVLK